jgi:hypothetical protein
LRPWRRDDEGRRANLVDELESRTVALLRQEGALADEGLIDWRKLRELIVKYLPQILQLLAILVTIFF